ncbi:MAG TPA: hypothetical protein VML54_11415, partial [Candidatus Limnocylindrales bacterium]|nr:hypothetical protein [Candidatus Limnocylindrales bacterium]
MAGAPHLLAWSLLLLYTVGSYRTALRGWWRHDDAYNLYFALRNGPWSQFVDPETWRSFATANLTPWIHFAYWLDAAMFGLAPAGF